MAAPHPALPCSLVLLVLLAAGCVDRRHDPPPRPDTLAPPRDAETAEPDARADMPQCLGDRGAPEARPGDLPPPDRAADTPRPDGPPPVDRGALSDGPLAPDLLPAPDQSITPDAPRLDAPRPDAAAPDLSSGRCPAGMVAVNNAFCMDRYEASRPDATALGEGSGTARALSRPGVLPWQGVDLQSARAACLAAGKSLCTLAQWITGCEGPNKTIYSYGNTYNPTTCNGIDTFCYCSSGSCASRSPCPFPHCFYSCGAAFSVEVTGARPGCRSAWGAYDVTGNVWELADTTDGLSHFRGGAFNCSDSKSLHRCDHDGTWGPSARGFRCCAPIK